MSSENGEEMNSAFSTIGKELAEIRVGFGSLVAKLSPLRSVWADNRGSGSFEVKITNIVIPEGAYNTDGKHPNYLEKLVAEEARLLDPQVVQFMREHQVARITPPDNYNPR
jgi:hypothetical protein